MDNDKHLDFIFFFVLFVIALIIGEANNLALNERAKGRDDTRIVMQTHLNQFSEFR